MSTGAGEVLLLVSSAWIDGVWVPYAGCVSDVGGMLSLVYGTPCFTGVTCLVFKHPML